MNGPEHYAEAERLVALAESTDWTTEVEPYRGPALAAAQVHATLARAPGEPPLSLIRELVEQMATRGGCQFRTADGVAHEVRAPEVQVMPGYEEQAVSLDNLRLILDAVGPL